MENFRCFRKPQSARLAPLTLLVGENSTGKTSFLALVRVLWKVAFLDEVPDFREEPYDLGTFADVVHKRGGRSNQPADFAAGFGYTDSSRTIERHIDGLSFEVSFEEREGFPFPVVRRLAREGDWVEIRDKGRRSYSLGVGSETIGGQEIRDGKSAFLSGNRLESLGRAWHDDPYSFSDEPDFGTVVLADDSNARRLAERIDSKLFPPGSPFSPTMLLAMSKPPFASAPVRSRPRRTYDPIPQRNDPEGNHIPTLLASMYQNSSYRWELLKESLEIFGRESGLFDEISIKYWGKAEGSPFQVQVRKFSGSGRSRQIKGPWRNLIDVGYGVSQVLPVLTQLLDLEPALLFLLQQPEVHLHPKAQAALGSLFCSVAGPERQLIVETHSDYLLDRVRMDVRDKKTGLKPEDVSILYFERDGQEVNIHSLRLDEMGNVLDAPPGYGQFFMDEVSRSIGF